MLVARATHRESGQTALVGWGGETYFEGLSDINHVDVALPGGRTCEATFTSDAGADRMQRIGPLRCGN
ncbi:FimD/PapC C-terminal domain-containing protein [Burkholderia sp. LMG 13014]|uniref:FimD/PapC C-terminal domain-containing protein n=1 Tax=Burkholderia sp. LMG 13014 TaxID=2709306 RepID=UPI001965760E|nr:FimD/PapC C-terminal domain-containing protein [Burkholderia sp. LMG 13014]